MDTQTKIYDNKGMWGKKYPETVLKRAKLTAAAVPHDVQTILEIGAGDGLVINALRKNGYDPFALDISRSALKHIEGEKTLVGNGAFLPFRSNSFDLVLACEMLEHIPIHLYSNVLDEIARVTSRYVIITVPYQENREWNLAQCPACGCIFNGAYHVRSFDENSVRFLFKKMKCLLLKNIVSVTHPDRTFGLELFIRHRLAMEFLYVSPSTICPLCSYTVDKKPIRNWVGWMAAAMRFFYRNIFTNKSPLWYLALYEKQ